MDKLKDIPIHEWKNVPISVYEKTLIEVKERFKFYTEETESVTQKIIQLLTIFVPFASASLLYLISKHSCIFINCVLIISYAITIFKCFQIIKKHKIQAPGSTPEYFLTNDFDNDEDEIKEKRLYKNLIEMYWYKINRMLSINSSRMTQYDHAILFAIASFFLTGIMIGFIIS